ncbi:sigma-54-dependent Fis family transcriptional regulator [Desulfovibrio sp. JC022]|uniref:sigma-54 interaction domain-containing protein n=1 Tax=Desulfovibrio sp. JC022 TaxID=2593642 RepID=UPI0013D7EEF6|nr:sigma 54-interacting transcriptional regulator [Desulfovibrio sp. JC022]NDV22260.1 PAS domain-containing protein [Desulfovibrio sp. JC022]
MKHEDVYPKRISPKYKYVISNYLCHVFDTMSDGLYISNKDGETLAVNTMYENLTGLEASDLLGRNVRDLVKDGTFDVALNSEVVKTKNSATTVQMTGKGRKVVLTAHPIFDYDEDVELVVTYVRDIALISQLKDQVAAQRQLIDKYQHGINQKPETLYLAPQSKVMKDLFAQVQRVAKTDATVLYLGETGVGKDVMAREMHDHSKRKSNSFFKVDCTCIPENLIESELFGYAPGAFSGADSKGKLGLFEMADKGTLFLDEIGELPMPMQGKLLRVLQDGEIQRVGATKARKIDVRVIAATNRNLEEEVKNGNFRSDLFYRLQVAVINIPPLRDRGEDLHAILGFFLKQFNTRYKRQVRLSAYAEEVMLNYRWPGNIRELENLIHSLVVTCDNNLIQIENLPTAMIEKSAVSKASNGLELNIDGYGGKDLKEIMAEFETQVLLNAVKIHGSIPKAAKALNVNRTTVFRKLKKAGVEMDGK